MNCNREIEALARGEGDVRGREGRAVDRVIDVLDDGELRVAEPRDGDWVTNAWVKQAILLYFARAGGVDRQSRSGRAVYYDKLPVNGTISGSACAAFRRASRATEAFSGAASILMPGFVNIGAYVDEGT